MADSGYPLGQPWSQQFPFLRLFHALPLALSFNRMLLGLGLVLCVYLGGRVLDGLWGSRGAVIVAEAGGTRLTDIDVFAAGNRAAFDQWRKEAEKQLKVEGSGLKTRGPFDALLYYEIRRAAAAAQAICAGRLGYHEAGEGRQPGLLSSLSGAGSGVVWLVTRRPWYTLFFGLLLFAACGYFGGAICRSAALQLARDESLSAMAALKFVRARFKDFLLAPLMPIGFLVVLALLMFVGGLIGRIPWLGELLSGLLFGLAILGGLTAALLILALILGYPLMLPTLATEGSDAFDAFSRAVNYVGVRIWHVLFYAVVSLIYGGLALALLRAVVVLALKCAHFLVGTGFNLFSSRGADGVGKLDAMWSMPAWSEIQLFPVAGGPPLWGEFAKGPLSGAESVGYFLIAVWVFLFVGLLAAFAVAFFFCISTEVYFLLRRDVDATDYDEVYYEEDAADLLGETPAPAAHPAAPPGTTPLNVVTPTQPPP